MNWQDDYSRGFLVDGVTLLLGRLIGRGMSRDVYEYRPFPDSYVVKVEDDAGRFQNVMEHHVWEAVRDSKLARWFAPMPYVSNSGGWVLQRRTFPVQVEVLRKRLPKVPRMFTDLKATNWGWLDGKLVCHDYGFLLTSEVGLTAAERKADWM